MDVVRRTFADATDGIYLYGSAVAGGLKPGSDLDVFALLNRRTTEQERRELVERLTPMSSVDARPAGWRPVELTVAATQHLRPWRYPPRVEFQFGEWLRTDFEAGVVPSPHESSDLAVLIADVRLEGRSLYGTPAHELLDAVPARDLACAMRDSLPALVEDLGSDTANVLLTLARMLYTLQTGRFVPKDVAAEWASAHLSEPSRSVLERAGAVYLGDAPDVWPGLQEGARACAAELVTRIRSDHAL